MDTNFMKSDLAEIYSESALRPFFAVLHEYIIYMPHEKWHSRPTQRRAQGRWHQHQSRQPNTGTAQPSVDRGTSKKNVSYPYNGVPFSHRKKYRSMLQHRGTLKTLLSKRSRR